MTKSVTKFSIEELLIREFAGPPARVAVNVVITASAGVLFDYYALGTEISQSVVFGALMAPLLAIIAAGVMKADRKRR